MSGLINCRMWADALGCEMDAMAARLKELHEIESLEAQAKALSAVTRCAIDMCSLQEKARNADKHTDDAATAGAHAADKIKIETLRHQVAERLCGIAISAVSERDDEPSSKGTERCDAGDAAERLAGSGA